MFLVISLISIEVFVYIYICMYVCVYIYIYIYIYTGTSKNIRISRKRSIFFVTHFRKGNPYII